MIPLLWIVLSVFEVQRGAFAVSSAARSAGRAFALAPNDAVGRARADAAVRQALADQGLEGETYAVEITCMPNPRDCHHGTSVITVQISSNVDVPVLPEVLGGDAPSVKLDAEHTVPIGQYQEVDP